VTDRQHATDRRPPAGRATGLGSWPGEDVLDAARTVFGELGEPPHLPHLPELPDRGPGADLLGRAAALLVDLPVDLQPSGWRLVDRPGRDLERSRARWRQDLDVLAEVADGYRGDLKVQVAGPWTLAAGLRLPRLERAVVDPGARRDLVASLAEGVARHIGEVRSLVPGARVVLQLDEPGLPSVLAGALATASGFGRLPAIAEPVVVAGLEEVLQAARAAGAVETAVHCCAAGAPVPVLVQAGADALSLEVALLGVAGWERVAAAVEAGTRLWAGVGLWDGVRDARPIRAVAAAAADSVTRPWRRVGLPPAGLRTVVATPPCGLAGAAGPQAARRVLDGCRAVAELLAERAEE
jgi:hypothetical protein